MVRPWEQRWIVGERLGKGGQGITDAVKHREDSSIHGALKYLKNNRDEQARGRMRREVANLQALAKAGGSVPRVLDENTQAFESPGVELFVVMDLIPGPTLRDFVESKEPLDIDTAVTMALSLCKTTRIALSFPILHRDLKPENIIVRNGNPSDLVVVDYGLSFNATDEQLTETADTFRNRFLDLPETNIPGGNLRDPRSDLTAICAVLYFCLTKHGVGQLQDASGNLPHFRAGYALGSHLAPDARLGKVEAFLTRGLTPNVANRFQAISEIVDYLTPLIDAPRDIDESDPLQLAASLSKQLRLTDRKTQLAGFSQEATKLFQFLSKEHAKYANKLEQFQFTMPGGGFRPPLTLAAGLDEVLKFQPVFTLQAQHHHLQANRQFIVASRGEKCVLLAFDYYVEQQKQHARSQTSLTNCQEIAWFDGAADQIFQLTSLALREWITASMKAIAAAIHRTP